MRPIPLLLLVLLFCFSEVEGRCDGHKIHYYGSARFGFYLGPTECLKGRQLRPKSAYDVDLHHLCTREHINDHHGHHTVCCFSLKNLAEAPGGYGSQIPGVHYFDHMGGARAACTSFFSITTRENSRRRQPKRGTMRCRNWSTRHGHPIGSELKSQPLGITTAFVHEVSGTEARATPPAYDFACESIWENTRQSEGGGLMPCNRAPRARSGTRLRCQVLQRADHRRPLWG